VDHRVAAASIGLLRAATAVEEELALIRAAHPRAGFPHADLVAALPEPGQLHKRGRTFCQEVAALPADHALTTITSTSKQLSSLHAAAQGMRSAVEWSSTFTAIDWWVSRRVGELGLQDKRVLIAPGRLGDFSIERTSRFRELMLELGEGGRLLCGDDGELLEEFRVHRDLLAHIHLLRVPPSDGISPAWHPLVVGHEVAHLRYTDLSVRDWLASRDAENGSALAAAAIAAAQEYTGTTGVQLISRSKWLGQLERWLTEIACDSVAVALYGDAGMESLRTILTAYAVPISSASHPAPELRLAIQKAAASSDLDEYRPPGDPFATADSQATNALVDLAVALRDHVRNDVGQLVGSFDFVGDIAASVESALAAEMLPSSSDWPDGNVGANATAIESGIVRGLWNRQSDLANSLPASEKKMRQAVAFVSQAIDALEFAARFDAQREDLGVEANERMPLPNVLWLGHSGVRTRADEPGGRPAHDLRLGRHFIVFQRSSIASIRSLTAGSELEAIQRSVQVGWGDEFVLHPAELVLAVTFECLRLDTSCAAQVLSRSSLGRLGLLSATAIQVQPGYHGCLTLELVNLANVPLRLSPGQRVAQIVPVPALGQAEGYAGAYQDSGAKPQYSHAREDWDSVVLQRMTKKAL
jgi:deoxycytidine triphosphate deaminase